MGLDFLKEPIVLIHPIRRFAALALIAGVAGPLVACHSHKVASTIAIPTIALPTERAESYVDPKPALLMEPVRPFDERLITPVETVGASAP